jgi:hypothetical protein
MYLFELLKQRSDFHFVLKASFLEIYNEKVCLIITLLLNAWTCARISYPSSVLQFRFLTSPSPQTVPTRCILFQSICKRTPTHLGTHFIKFTLEEAMKAEKESRGIALLLP